MTKLEKARKGIISEEMKICAAEEGVEPDYIRQCVAEGTIVIVRNVNHTEIKPLAIGCRMRTKINTNIGTSNDHVDLKAELEKLSVAVSAGTDAVMDLSTGGDLAAIRKAVVGSSPVITGTVPIYQAAVKMIRQRKAISEMTADDIFEVIEENGKDGVDFITVHCGVTQQSVSVMENQGRVLGIVSRGGSITANWMRCNKKENPLYKYYDRLLEIARHYDMILSLGDGLRPGAIEDATDKAQIAELILLGELAVRAKEAGVQVMIEGPGHVPLMDIEANVRLQKKICKGAPFYVLGPLPTDIAPGYDHITSAIGGAIAGAAGADFLCYVTPAEHLRLPTLEDVRDGVIAAKIAAHIADIVKGINGARERDKKMSQCRKEFDWQGQVDLSIDPKKTIELLEKSKSANEEGCTMCGEFCAIKLGRK
ncbi:MAG TPA: phosphomethylpyrimidine synthase ThiC [Smithellaceae bacterium]|jgi:phosphomethylpyrimidine synthase|nr:MAG: Phosphomethylpyrimidine synthase [Deltaproteobacteria bacterium ADurb.BinA014]HNQ17960.1 phosphomethylpyrimidine synthase ThiC [Smithellaceae bacterium]HNT90623.1 phosphomethylpyrimidine synthase ThiC [Smithellaceae bacterium]HNV65366.1 phosphomethylpyrimidine synthase ThiC [Smithellaceae bacterium]HNZ30497.1 phosphomethylpyrimidine synthase ThiC [Smithellaceae bacterium]